MTKHSEAFDAGFNDHLNTTLAGSRNVGFGSGIGMIYRALSRAAGLSSGNRFNVSKGYAANVLNANNRSQELMKAVDGKA